MRPVCVECRAEMHPVKNGQPVIHEENKTTVHCGDKWGCPLCEKEVVSGFGAPSHITTDPDKWRLQPVYVRSWQEIKAEKEKRQC